MIKSLEAGELDLAIGLTEGWVTALANGADDFKLVGKYVSSPLCWAISTGAERTDVNSVSDLASSAGEKKKLGISRYGSGSYVMGFVFADQSGWLEAGSEPFDWQALDNFKNLRDAVRKIHPGSKEADAFMWEHFTTKYLVMRKCQGAFANVTRRKYYDNGELKKIGEIFTPWPSWHIVAHTSLTKSTDGVATISAFAKAVEEGILHFNAHHDEAVEYISTNLDYSAEDAREWLKTVVFSDQCKNVENDVIEKAVAILKKAGVVKGGAIPVENMIVNMH